MKILFINSVCGIGSTGRICLDLAKEYHSQGHSVKIAFGRDFNVPEEAKKFAVPIGCGLSVKLSALYTRITDKHGLCSKHETKRFLMWLDEYLPDLIWIHNLHGYYVNYEMLFGWIKRHPQIRIKWTLHDCWAFTGHCSHFSAIGCEKWKNQCNKCPNLHQYPASYLIDNSYDNYLRKKKSFSNVKNMEIIVPSHWLENFVKQSFLSSYPIKVVPNKINSEFKKSNSTVRKDLKLENKTVILGVANIWAGNKGLEDFKKLSSMLDENYAILIVGEIKGKKVDFTKNIICLGKTNSITELAQYYSVADFFVNPSKEETFGMTVAEAAACGAKVIVYKNTACEEVALQLGGIAVEPGAENIYKVIKQDWKLIGEDR